MAIFHGDVASQSLLQELGAVQPSAAGLEQVRLYDGYTQAGTGEVAAGLEGLAGAGLVRPGGCTIGCTTGR